MRTKTKRSYEPVLGHNTQAQYDAWRHKRRKKLRNKMHARRQAAR